MRKNSFRSLCGLVACAAWFGLAATTLAEESEIMYLSGRGIDDTKTWRFRCTAGQRAGKWGKIEVPSQWETQGYGDYTYGRWYVADKGVEIASNKAGGGKTALKPSDEEGFYEYTFTVPAAWRDRTVTIWFDGVMTDTEVAINGQSAGEMHQGGFYRFHYDITSLIQPGKKNKLEVHVYKHSANKSINAAERKADWWLFGGIYRPVWLEAAPAAAVTHVAVDARADGSLQAHVETSAAAEGCTIVAEVRTLDGSRTVGTSRAFKAVAGGEQTVSMDCAGVKPWTCETPNLYLLDVTLRDADGKAVHSRTTRIGFRTIEFRPKDGLYLNGTKLIVKGVNRHSFWPTSGRATSKRLSDMDARLIKGMNMNAVRSHYPPDEHFLDACDSIGLLYLDELAGWQNNYDDAVGAKLLREMIRRDVNHPCIFLWSNGNEGGWNTHLDAHFADYDPQGRHVVHPWADFDQLDTHHYPAYLTGVARFTNGSNVFMPTEFMHAMYDQGGGAGLADFWNRWLTSPLFAGGFIWVYCDEAVVRTDQGGILDSDKSNAPDGIVGPRREKEGSYYAIREVWSPIQIKPVRITPSFDGTLHVTNGYLFSNLEGCRLDYDLIACPSPMNTPADGLAASRLGGGTVTLPDIAPGETRRVQLPALISPRSNPHWMDADVLQVAAIGIDGDTVCHWTFPIHTPAEYFVRNLAATPSTLQLEHPVAQTEGNEIRLANSRLAVRFSNDDGKILSIRKGDTEIPFRNGPVAVGMKMKYRPDLSSVRIEGENAIFVARYQGGVDSIVWRLTHDGWLAMDAVMLNRAGGGGGFDDAFMDSEVYNLGLTFSYPDSLCTGMTWLGRGPYRVWKNRLPGTNYSVWHKAYNNTITGESFENLVYPEFKGYHANLYWARLESDIAPMTIHCTSENIYLRLFTPEEPAGRAGGKRTMPAFPAGDISFLLDIPAIQSFKPISQQGPQSQPGNIRIKKGDDGLRIQTVFAF